MRRYCPEIQNRFRSLDVTQKLVSVLLNIDDPRRWIVDEDQLPNRFKFYFGWGFQVFTVLKSVSCSGAKAFSIFDAA